MHVHYGDIRVILSCHKAKTELAFSDYTSLDALRGHAQEVRLQERPLVL